MLIATILGVLLIPMLYVAVEKVDRRSAHAPAPAPAAANWPRNTDRGATEMPTPPRSCRVCCVVVASLALTGCTGRAELRSGPRCRRRRNTASSKRRAAGAVAGGRARGSRCSTTRRCRRWSGKRSTNNLDLRVAVAHVEEARARAGIAKSYLYPQVDGTAGYGVRGASTTGGRTTTRRIRAASTASSCRGRSICSAGCGEGRKRRSRCALASEQGRRGVLVTLVGDVATNYFHAARARSAARRSPARRSASTTRPSRYFQRPSGGRRVEPPRARSHSGAARSRPRRRFRRSSVRWRLVENQLSLLLGRPPGAGRARALWSPTNHCRRRFRRACRRRCSNAGPTSSQAEQVLVAANADIGVAKSLFYPTISLTGFLGGVSGDLTSFLGGDGGGVVAQPESLSADLSGRPHPPESRSGAGAIRRRRSPTTRRPRSTAIARSPTRW